MIKGSAYQGLFAGGGGAGPSEMTGGILFNRLIDYQNSNAYCRLCFHLWIMGQFHIGVGQKPLAFLGSEQFAQIRQWGHSVSPALNTAPQT